MNTLVLAVTLWAMLPTVAMAECDGPACGPTEAGGDGIQGIVVIVILVAVAVAMAVTEARSPD